MLQAKDSAAAAYAVHGKGREAGGGSRNRPLTSSEPSTKASARNIPSEAKV